MAFDLTSHGFHHLVDDTDEIFFVLACQTSFRGFSDSKESDDCQSLIRNHRLKTEKSVT